MTQLYSRMWLMIVRASRLLGAPAATTCRVLPVSFSRPRSLFLMFDSSVLEPNLDLFFAQVKSRRNLNAAQARQVLVLRELLFQLQQLRTAESCAKTLATRWRLAQRARSWRRVRLVCFIDRNKLK